MRARTNSSIEVGSLSGLALFFPSSLREGMTMSFVVHRSLKIEEGLSPKRARSDHANLIFRGSTFFFLLF